MWTGCVFGSGLGNFTGWGQGLIPALHSQLPKEKAVFLSVSLLSCQESTWNGGHSPLREEPLESKNL